ncbi:hypothetical protein KKA95_00015 [Patescibacteria group bacterium]|nr:hypothetical protein [Patescibacteria group bacterium]
MLGKLFKLVVVAIAIYLVLQIPAVKNWAGGIYQSVIEKKDNVVEEYDRVKEKVDNTVDKVEEVKEGVEGTIDTVNETVDKVGELSDKVGELFTGVESEEGAVQEECTDEQKAAEICTMDYTPVCGDDGVTYGNACTGCASGNIDTYVLGEC